MNFLAIGVNVRDIACSINRLGQTAFTVNYFNSVDANSCSQECLCYLPEDHIDINDLSENPSAWQKFYSEAARSILETSDIDYIVPKINNELIDRLGRYAPIIGNPPEALKKASDKWNFYKLAKKLGIKTPKTRLADDDVSDLGFPLILKPRVGSRGKAVSLIESRGQLENAIERLGPSEKNFVLQEYIPGESYNLSLISTGDEAKPIFVSRQIFNGGKFSYSGNIGPVKVDGVKEITGDFIELYVKLGLKGCLGGDFIVTPDGDYCIVELNPRLQGSCEVAKASLGINIFEYHFKAWQGELLDIPGSKRFAGKKILFSRKRCRAADLSRFDFVRDIPFEGALIKLDNPVCTILVSGDSEYDIATELGKKSQSIYKSLH